MWNKPEQEVLNRIPTQEETDKIPLKEKMIYLHLILGDYEWYVTAYDKSDRLYGFVVLSNPVKMVGLMCFSFDELQSFSNTDGEQIFCFEDWVPTQACKVSRLRFYLP